MKIALIVQRFPHGGAESYVEQIANRLYEKGEDVTVISTSNKNCDDKLYSFKIIRLPKLFSIGDYAFWRGLGNSLKKGRFDIVHVNTYGYFHSDYAAAQKKKFHYKLVMTSHGFTGIDVYQLKKNKTIQKNSVLDVVRPFYDKKIGQKTLRHCDHLIALSRKDSEFYTQIGVDHSKITVIPPGIRESFFVEPNTTVVEKIRSELDTDLALLSVGELSWIKSQAVMIRAMPLIMKKKPRAKLFLIGQDRTELQNLKQLSDKLGVKNNVYFLGPKDAEQVRNYMYATDLLLQTSLAEGMSTVLLESMACGLPFITTPTGGNGYLAQDGGAGITIPFEDEKALVNQILDINEDEKRMRIMRSNGKIMARDLRWDKVFPKIAKVYSNLLNIDSN